MGRVARPTGNSKCLARAVIEDCLTLCTVQVDVYCLDHAGNLADATILAAIAALSDVNLPGVRLNEEGKAAVSYFLSLRTLKRDGCLQVVLDTEAKGHKVALQACCTPLTYAVVEG